MLHNESIILTLKEIKRFAKAGEKFNLEMGYGERVILSIACDHVTFHSRWLKWNNLPKYVKQRCIFPDLPV